MQLHVRLLCLGLLALSATGCESTNWNWLKRDTGRDVATTVPVFATGRETGGVIAVVAAGGRVVAAAATAVAAPPPCADTAR